MFPFTHIGGIAWLFTMLITGCRAVFVEAFAPVTTIPVLQRERITLAGAGTAFHLAYLAAQREQPGTPLFPDVRVFPGGAAPKPPQLHYEMQAELGGVGIVSGYGLTEAPILTMNRVTDSDEQLAETEGGPTPGVELRIVRGDGTEAAPEKRERSAPKARRSSSATSTARSTQTHSTTTAGSAPAIWGRSALTNTSASRAGSRT